LKEHGGGFGFFLKVIGEVRCSEKEEIVRIAVSLVMRMGTGGFLTFIYISTTNP
jgi:hypothetical protein